MDKIVDRLRQADARPLCVADLVQASGMSERTLRSWFRRCFGVAPHRYLHIRRMHLIRIALSMSGAGQDTVAAVAKRFGYADAGRMASAYLDLFGEYPQQTLERRLGE
ncbi:helix-turn-helix transcriptional regulator [Tahibacter harae]|uniref:AraC family transcriptional regulator n=1 Tax=Tahibacter harae TaxID=2963937 RepID=A0ABT1QQS3_9GAMM|nr:AraC family transcriptional regulator [Tahibacter harae]